MNRARRRGAARTPEGAGHPAGEAGHEHFNGSLVIPVFNLDGEVVQMYGRKITPNLRRGHRYHLYLPGPHAECGTKKR